MCGTASQVQSNINNLDSKPTSNCKQVKTKMVLNAGFAEKILNNLKI